MKINKTENKDEKKVSLENEYGQNNNKNNKNDANKERSIDVLKKIEDYYQEDIIVWGILIYFIHFWQNWYVNQFGK